MALSQMKMMYTYYLTNGQFINAYNYARILFTVHDSSRKEATTSVLQN